MPPRAAYWRAKLVGSTSRSVASPARVFDQVEPPSADRKTPRSGEDGKPSNARPADPFVVAARSVLGFVGSTLMSLKVLRAKVAAARSCQVAPPSVDFRSPAPP